MNHMINLINFQDMEAEMSDKTYSIRQLSQRFNVSPATIGRWIEAGLFPGASKKNPLAPNSPYEIPQSAVDHYEDLRKTASES